LPAQQTINAPISIAVRLNQQGFDAYMINFYTYLGSTPLSSF